LQIQIPKSKIQNPNYNTKHPSHRATSIKYPSIKHPSIKTQVANPKSQIPSIEYPSIEHPSPVSRLVIIVKKPSLLLKEHRHFMDQTVFLGSSKLLMVLMVEKII
jgi:hypothetical protein